MAAKTVSTYCRAVRARATWPSRDQSRRITSPLPGWAKLGRPAVAYRTPTADPGNRTPLLMAAGCLRAPQEQGLARRFGDRPDRMVCADRLKHGLSRRCWRQAELRG